MGQVSADSIPACWNQSSLLTQGGAGDRAKHRQPPVCLRAWWLYISTAICRESFSLDCPYGSHHVQFGLPFVPLLCCFSPWNFSGLSAIALATAERLDVGAWRFSHLGVLALLLSTLNPQHIGYFFIPMRCARYFIANNGLFLRYRRPSRRGSLHSR
jgi:hypothetical protein